MSSCRGRVICRRYKHKARKKAKAALISPPSPSPHSQHEMHKVVAPFDKVIKDFMFQEFGKQAHIKTEQFRISCGTVSPGRGSHPRVALFRRMANFGAINDDDPPEEPWPTLKISCCMQLLSWLRIATPDPDRSKDTRLLLDMKDVKKLCDHLVRVGLLPDVAAGRFYYALGDAVRLPLWDVMNLPPEMMLTPQAPDATAASAPTTPRRTSLLSSAAKGASAATPKLDAVSLSWLWAQIRGDCGGEGGAQEGWRPEYWRRHRDAGTQLDASLLCSGARGSGEAGDSGGGEQAGVNGRRRKRWWRQHTA